MAKNISLKALIEAGQTETIEVLIAAGHFTQDDLNAVAASAKEAVAKNRILDEMKEELDAVVLKFCSLLKTEHASEGGVHRPCLTLAIAAPDKGKKPSVKTHVAYKNFKQEDFNTIHKVYYHASSLKSDASDMKEEKLNEEINDI